MWRSAIVHPVRVPDRSFRAFLRAVPTEPGMALRLVALAALGIALSIQKGWLIVLVTLAGCVLLGCLLGYPYFRRHGRLLGGVRRPGT